MGGAAAEGRMMRGWGNGSKSGLQGQQFSQDPRAPRAPPHTTWGRRMALQLPQQSQHTCQSHSPAGPPVCHTGYAHRATHLVSQSLHQETEFQMTAPVGERVSWPESQPDWFFASATVIGSERDTRSKQGQSVQALERVLEVLGGGHGMEGGLLRALCHLGGGGHRRMKSMLREAEPGSGEGCVPDNT